MRRCSALPVNDYGFGMPDKIPGDEYVLHMNAETAHIVARACEFYARIIMGQFEEVQHLTVWPVGENDPTFGERIQKCSDALREAKRAAFPEFPAPDHHYHKVGRSRDGDTAWNVYQAVRYIKAWHEHPEGGYIVNFHRPMKNSDAPMPRCEVRDGNMEWHECFIDPSTGELVDTDKAVKDFEKKYGD
jgi:hypothetical protein